MNALDHWRRCQRKVPHPTRSEAEDALRYLNHEHPGEEFRVYRCPSDGHHYHVGHLPWSYVRRAGR